jgi:pre-mRNA-processing factor 8
VTVLVAFTPGSVTLNSGVLTEEGYNWGATNFDLSSQTPQGYSPTFTQRSQIVLSNRIVGSFMVPDDGIWNYTFLGPIWNPKDSYGLKIDIPYPFYHDLHRPIHFATYNEIEGGDKLEATQESSLA